MGCHRRGHLSGRARRARTNAVKSGVSIRTEKAAYDTFDFGVERWDLVAVVFAWAPVSDPAFVAQLRTSLRPGGIVLFEHFVDNPDDRSRRWSGPSSRTS